VIGSFGAAATSPIRRVARNGYVCCVSVRPMVRGFLAPLAFMVVSALGTACLTNGHCSPPSGCVTKCIDGTTIQTCNEGDPEADHDSWLGPNCSDLGWQTNVQDCSVSGQGPYCVTSSTGDAFCSLSPTPVAACMGGATPTVSGITYGCEGDTIVACTDGYPSPAGSTTVYPAPPASDFCFVCNAGKVVEVPGDCE